jgi:cobalt-zinc-cadmium efflux system protein
MGDTISSFFVIVAGVVIMLIGWSNADAVAAIIIGVIILWGAGKIVKEATDILLEAAPKHLAPAEVTATIKGIRCERVA